MSDTDIECPQCGAMVYYELVRCPECGLEFYPPEHDIEEASEPQEGKGWGTSLIAIMLGWLVSGFVTFFLFGLSKPFLPEVADWQGQDILFVAGAAFIGGYVANGIAKRLPILHGLFVALPSIIIAIVLETLWRDITTATLVRPMTLLVWTVIIMSGVAGAVTSMYLQKRAAQSQQ